jgi:hypothetical protein
MNMKKTALATAIALTMAGGGSAWAETSTVKGQFILDKQVVTGGETVNLALLGLNENGEVDRFGEEKGSTIMALVETIKGEIQRGSTHPGSIPNDTLPMPGHFSSQVRYVALDQGVGRVSIFYPDEIVDDESTEDILTVFLQERIPTHDGGVRFERIGQAVKKTITIKAGTTEPIAFSIASFEQSINDPIQKPVEIPDPVEEDWAFYGEMTAGYSGAVFKVVGDEDLQGTTRAPIHVNLKLQQPNRGEVIYEDTQRLIRGEATFTVTDEITEAGLYDVIVSLEGKEEMINNVRMLSKDTLRVWPRSTAAKSMLMADKTRVARAAGALFGSDGHCNGSLVCQGTKLTLKLLDEFGNEMTSHPDHKDSVAHTLTVKDSNNVFATRTIPFSTNEVEKELVLGDDSGEILKTGTSSLAATGGSLANSNVVAIQVVDNSLSAVATDLFAYNPDPDPENRNDQKAGTEFDAFKVVIKNNAGQTLPVGSANTSNPGPIKVTTSMGESITVERKLDPDKKDIIEVYFETATDKGTDTDNKYLLTDTGGKYGQVWAEGSKMIPAAAFKVTLHNAIGDEIMKVNPRYDLEKKRYITKLPERNFLMQDAYGNEITENVGEFSVSSANATITYNNTKGSNVGEVARNPGGEVHLAYNPSAFSGEDKITMTFKKPALSSKTLQITTAIPEALDTGLGDIVSYIETNDLPVNSEVALKVETLDKQGKLFKNESLVLTVTFNEEEEALAAIDLDPDSDEPDHIITPTVRDLLNPDVDQEGNFVASGGRLSFGEGRKLFVVEAGPRPGKFSLTFKDANNPSNKEVRIFKVTHEIQEEIIIDEPTCLTQGDYWAEDAEVCHTMPDVGNPIPGKATSGLVDKNGLITFTSNAHFNGGVVVGTADDETNPFNSEASMELTAEGENVLFAGNIQFAPSHAGEMVDIVIAVSYQVGAFGSTQWFSFDPTKGLMPWNGHPKNLATVMEHEVVKDENLLVTIYDGPLGEDNILPGALSVYLAYRRDNGEVHFNALPITLRMQ